MDNDFKPSLIDKEQATFFRERWQAVYQIEQEEKKAATFEQRWQQLNNIIRLATGLGLSLQPDESKMIVYQRMAKLKQMAIA